MGTPDVHVPPRLAASLGSLEDALWTSNDPELLDLCRIRLGQLMGRELGRRAAAPAKVAALRQWPTDPAFSEAERALLDFCELYAIDAQAITDAQTERLHEHFDAPTLAALTMGIAVYDALVRVANAQES